MSEVEVSSTKKVKTNNTLSSSSSSSQKPGTTTTGESKSEAKTTTPTVGSGGEQPWIEKYRPARLDDIAHQVSYSLTSPFLHLFIRSFVLNVQ